MTSSGIVDELTARHEIAALVMRRGRSADAKDPDAIAACHVPGSRDEHGIFNGTIEEFVEHLRRNHYAGDTYGPQRHYVSNLVIDLTGADHAEAESLHLAVHRVRLASGEFDVEIGGRYLDVFERVDERWLIRSRSVVYDWSNVVPVTPDRQPAHPSE